MNITHVKLALSSDKTIQRIRTAIDNTHRKGFSVDHVMDSKGKRNFLSVRVRGGKLSITDRNNTDITQLIVKVLRDRKEAMNKDIERNQEVLTKEQIRQYTK